MAIIKRLNQLEKGVPNFNNPAEAARAWAIEYEKKQQLQIENKELKPKGEFYDLVTASETQIDMGECAKVIDLDIGRNNLFKLLREKKVLMVNNQPYQRYIDSGHFKLVENVFKLPDGTPVTTTKTVVKPAGIRFIKKILRRESK
jgi:anti-repressor protein